MIHWLVQATSEQPDLAQGMIPARMLHAQEQEKLASLKTEKRRSDWVLGRWTAKNLLQGVVGQANGAPPPLDRIRVLNGRQGDPVLPEYPGMSLSISHSNSHAFCAVLERPSWPIGADIEQIAPRNAVFVADYFTPQEQALVDQAPAERRDLMVTAIWSGKESVLKALRLGLTVDTRCVSCIIQLPATPPQVWSPFDVICDGERLPVALPPLAGWWRVWDEFVLTLVAQTAVSP